MSFIRPQKYFMSESIQLRMVNCLRTDTPIPDIARRFGVSRSLVVQVNKRFKIRAYQGKRASWVWDVGYAGGQSSS